MGFQTIKTPKFYLTGTQLWVEMSVDIIRKVSEEHEECMKSPDDVRIQQQLKHTGVGKTSQPKLPNNIQSTRSAFQQIPQAIGEDHEASLVLKERGSLEVITLAAEFQNPSGTTGKSSDSTTECKWRYIIISSSSTVSDK